MDEDCTCTPEQFPFCEGCRLRLLWAFSAILYGLHQDMTLPSALPGRN